MGAPRSRSDPLSAGFASPPDSAKPRVYWHWLNGNITKEGIEKDLQWMKRIGIGGLQHFDGTFDTPKIVEHRLVYMSSAWQEAFRYAVQRATDLGLEFAIASSPGWSETGGPWVDPREGMKKLVWSETRLPGGQAFEGSLASPPSNAGPFQNLPAVDPMSSEILKGPQYYEDIAVLAYRTLRPHLSHPRPTSVTSSDPSVNAAALTANDPVKLVTLPVALGRPGWILYDYGQPQCFCAASLARPSKFFMTRFTWLVEASLNGEHYHPVVEFPADCSLSHTTVSFRDIVARYLRLTVAPAPLETWLEFAANAPGAEPVAIFCEPVEKAELYRLQFYSTPRVHRFEEKAGFAIAPSYYELDSTAANSPEEGIDPKEILNLTDRTGPDGTLRWMPPEGDWTVLRLGFSLTGKTNHPATPEATGLEVDKFDKRAVKAYLDHYLGNFERCVGPERMGTQGVRAFLTDSIESRGQNWTRALIEEFKARRGYDPTFWLPALTGVPVGGCTRTDRFLWDFRKTLMELMSDAHYQEIAASVHARHLTYYSESLEGYPDMALGDDLDMRAAADIPMAAVWTNYKAAERDGVTNHIADMRGAASVAHILGKNVVAVEALTSAYEPWVYSPAKLRPVIDLAFALGMNLPVVHTSVHQPVDKKPGITLGPCGQHFTRHETWGELATPWITYLARCSYLLQQGTPVTDVAWFYGEDGSLAGLCAKGLPNNLPEGYGFDFISPNLLLNHLTVREGRLVSSGGASYRLLYLGGISERMTLAVLRKIRRLADEGAKIAGPRPTGSPSLADESREREYQQLIKDLWNTGRILDANCPSAELHRLGVPRDFACVTETPRDSVLFRHRALPGGDIYFVANRQLRAVHIQARFRVTGRRPEIWHAETGQYEATSWQRDREHTIVPLRLDATHSVFVVFREPTDSAAETVNPPREIVLERLTGKWDLSFEPDLGAPSSTISTPLGSWTGRHEFGIKYFSGTGTYRKQFELSVFDVRPNERVILDLGEVNELAEVKLNDSVVGIAWRAPYRLDVTEKLKYGNNTVEVRVANLWVNRLIGDKQPGASPIAFTVTSTYKADAPLRPSGLIGPVVLIRRTEGDGT